MRTTRKNDGIQLQGIAGTHVVLLGWDMSKQDTRGVLGFAIHRTDHTENEAYWLKGMKTFESTDPGQGPGALYSTRKNPVQGFTWSDFTAKPSHRYTYRVIALDNTPEDLKEKAAVEITVATDIEGAGVHKVWFNRGAAASQEYARRFQNRRPSEVGRPAFIWLSRGLEETMLSFIEQAKGARYGLRVAAYQFTYGPVLDALHQAHLDGADVQILYDARKDDIAKPNNRAVHDAQIGGLCRKRTADSGKIAHNKFIVLLKDDNPVALWTGSTNFTEGGIFGHSDVGHVVNNADIAGKFLDYWDQLHADPVARDLRVWVMKETPTPNLGQKPPVGTSVLFSPRSGLTLLDWYAELAGSAKSLLCMTFAFGINKKFHPVLEAGFDGLRYALLDSKGNTEAAKNKVLELRKKVWNRFSVGNFISQNNFDCWLREKLSGLNRHAQFIHTKFMLVDPLSSDPVIVTGSANFSDASVRDNDENMLLIRGDQNAADIYLTEYFRLWNHYAFREWAACQTDPSASSPRHLLEDDGWRNTYYGDTDRSRQRRIFAGT